MSAYCIDVIRDCLEGFVPAVLATCDSEGVPNVSIISQVHYVDPERVALSYQFFNKTRHNILTTRAAAISVFDPVGLADYRLDLIYEGTETEGPLFESMKAKLAGIASHSGMQGVFRLLGADIFRVRSITLASGPRAAQAPAPRNLLSALRRSTAELASVRELGDLFDRTLGCLVSNFGIEHAMILMLDEAGGRLYTVASVGYASSGIGSELSLGDGVIGVAAREAVPIRIGHMTSDYSYSSTVRDQERSHGRAGPEGTEISYPGLAAPESQIAMPIRHGGRTLGVLFIESTEPMRFRYDDEDALALIAERIAGLIILLQQDEAIPAPAPIPPQSSPISKQTIVVRRYQADNSIFLDHDYLIKGVAGAIFWKLAREHAEAGRVEFSNRELRLDPALRLPEHVENLEARLVLLQRRLSERKCPIQIEKCGRGRLRLIVPGALRLEEIGAPITA